MFHFSMLVRSRHVGLISLFFLQGIGDVLCDQVVAIAWGFVRFFFFYFFLISIPCFYLIDVIPSYVVFFVFVFPD